ncbi:hypothetical protein QAD02_023909 [Eretmocerus hayati]|uniref:Uncharacterized protein n=1 Tax=Eretmocerus hayati TaxID=131215 RepID=A0ACC2PZN3_9HYME|nr:hypothetical protein QAD02_023909 [Eretmocerus hayati]
MRFRFLGDVDCPDWLLTEIYNISQMPSTKMKDLGLVVIKSIAEEDFDMEKLEKLSADLNIESDDFKALFAALDMIFSSSTRNSVSPSDLNSELQQLGLPREHSGMISRLYTDHCQDMSVTLNRQSLRLSKLVCVEVKTTENPSPFAKVAFKTKILGNKEKETLVNIPKTGLQELLTDLRGARNMMEQILN